MRLLNLYCILTLAVPSLCSTVATILADIATIQNNLNTANTAITSLSPNIADISLTTPIQLLVRDLLSTQPTEPIFIVLIALVPSPVNETDGRVILDHLEALEPSIVDSTAKLVQRKAVVAAVPPIPLVGTPLVIARQTLVSLQTALNSLEDAAQKAAPASLLQEGDAFRDRLNNNLNTVIAAYSS
ncbi:hypothetical protein DXG01_001407 [Tephrocybe rancida]|nr:hypothetical protein DXG01_001407 [Tephrocybe rancida]